MKTFKDLKIKNRDSQKLKDILKAVITQLPSDWKFRQDLVSGYAKNVSKDPTEIGCFETPKIDGNTGLIWFVIWDNELKIVNIVPSESGSLTHDEYNQILDKFNDDCIAKVLSGQDIDITISKGIYDIQEIAGTKTYEALHKWEAVCNHSTGNTHPMDFERWATFVCTAHYEKSKLTPDLLDRWLVEERKWNDDELASKIVIDYEYGLSILDHYVKNY